MPLDGPSQASASGTTRQVVILLHGYGADGNDLIGLAPFFAQALPDAAFYSPHAPQPCEMAPFGRQWFSLSQYDPDMLRRDPQTMDPVYAEMLAGTQAAAGELDAYITATAAREGVGLERVALVGFSQGTMMALHTGLRQDTALAGILGYSGALVGADRLPAEITAKPPVLLVHGEADSVVPFEALGRAESGLKAAGVEVTTYARPGLEHGIDEVGITMGMEFLRKCFGVEV